MEQSRAAVEAKIKELGGYISGGINWDWAMFETDELAKEFHDWLGGEWETRGVYKGTATDLPGVRYR